MSEKLLAVSRLVTRFATEAGEIFPSRGVDLDLAPGEALGLVGESGSGKSVTARAAIRLLTPESALRDGSIRFRDLDLALARNEINVARYYLQRGAYLAAANRAQDAIKRFPTSPVQKDALDIIIEAYDRMGMPELRDDARKVLAKNFPADRMAREGQNRAKPWWKFWQ